MPEMTNPDLCYALAARRYARHVGRIYDSVLEMHGLTSSQFSILSLIEAYREVEIATLADSMVMERTTLVRALRPLLKAGLVDRRKRQGWKAHDWSLSPLGRETLANAMKSWEVAQRHTELGHRARNAEDIRETTLDVCFARIPHRLR